MLSFTFITFVRNLAPALQQNGSQCSIRYFAVYHYLTVGEKLYVRWTVLRISVDGLRTKSVGKNNKHA